MSFKKTLISILATATLCFAGCSSQLYQEDIPKNYKENPQIWSQLEKEKPTSLTGIRKFLFEKILFITEKKENWSSARKTLERGYGECDDIAIAGSYLAESLGYPPKMLFLVDPFKGGHSSTLLEKKTKDGVKYGCIDQTEIFYPTYDSIESLVNDINRSYEIIGEEAMKKYKIKKMNYGYYLVLDLDSLDKEWRTTDKNLALPQNEISLNLVQVPQSKNRKKNIEGYRISPSIIFNLPKENEK